MAGVIGAGVAVDAAVCGVVGADVGDAVVGAAVGADVAAYVGAGVGRAVCAASEGYSPWAHVVVSNSGIISTGEHR